LTIQVKGQVFYVDGCSHNEFTLLKQRGFISNPQMNRLETTRLRVAAGFREHFSIQAEKIFKAMTCEILSPWASGIKIPTGEKLERFQRLGVRHALERNNSYLAFQQGLGKTPTACAIANTLYEKTLVICPPDLIPNWARHAVKWTRFKKIMQVGVDGVPKGFDLLFCPDTLIDRSDVEWALKDHSFGLLIIEEAQRFLLPDARRTQAIFGKPVDGHNEKELSGLCHIADKVVCLSGTPMRSRPIEMFPVLSSLAANTIGYRNKLEYGIRYCAGFEGAHGWDFKGASNADEWRRNVMNVFMRREEQADHMKVKKEQQVIYLKNNLKPNTVELEKAILKGKKLADFIRDYEKLGFINKNAQLGKIASYRKHVAKAKVNYAVDHVRKILDQTDAPVLLLGYHELFIGELHAKLRKYSPIIVQGKTPKALRDERIAAFQRGASRLFIGQILTMVGHDLDRAWRVVFGEYDWTFSNNEQAMDRAFRKTQTKNVLVEWLCLEETLDEYILDANLKKKKVTGTFINNRKA
jgi:superfamily II DNA or RNA helicase